MSKITPIFVLLSLMFFVASVYAQSADNSTAPAQAPGIAMKQTFSGTLVDADCKAADAAGKCDIAGNTRAFGLATADGRYLIVDPDGNAKVKDAVKGKTGAIRASLTGKADGKEIRVESVQLDGETQSTN